MKKLIKNKMSIENPVLSIGKGFKRVEKLIEAKIYGIENRVQKIEAKI